ncbi:hypothetical protein GCM10029964_052390 [Kibdelosporangium lantanae]
MTEVQAPPYPQKRTCPYEPPAGYQEIADAGPVLRVTLYDGRESWIVTGYKESRRSSPTRTSRPNAPTRASRSWHRGSSRRSPATSR